MPTAIGRTSRRPPISVRSLANACEFASCRRECRWLTSGRRMSATCSLDLFERPPRLCDIIEHENRRFLPVDSSRYVLRVESAETPTSRHLDCPSETANVNVEQALDAAASSETPLAPATTASPTIAGVGAAKGGPQRRESSTTPPINRRKLSPAATPSGDGAVAAATSEAANLSPQNTQPDERKSKLDDRMWSLQLVPPLVSSQTAAANAQLAPLISLAYAPPTVFALPVFWAAPLVTQPSALTAAVAASPPFLASLRRAQVARSSIGLQSERPLECDKERGCAPAPLGQTFSNPASSEQQPTSLVASPASTPAVDVRAYMRAFAAKHTATSPRLEAAAAAPKSVTQPGTVGVQNEPRFAPPKEATGCERRALEAVGLNATLDEPTCVGSTSERLVADCRLTISCLADHRPSQLAVAAAMPKRLRCDGTGGRFAADDDSPTFTLPICMRALQVPTSAADQPIQKLPSRDEARGGGRGVQVRVNVGCSKD